MYDFSILEWFDTDDYILAAASEEYEKTALTQAPSSPSYSSNVEGEAAVSARNNVIHVLSVTYHIT